MSAINVNIDNKRLIVLDEKSYKKCCKLFIGYHSHWDAKSSLISSVC